MDSASASGAAKRGQKALKQFHAKYLTSGGLFHTIPCLWMKRDQNEETAMYAVIKTGGKQYKVAEGDLVRVEKLSGEKGDEITLDQVLLVAKDDDVTIGRPVLENATVKATIANQARYRKVLVFHKKRRQGYSKKYGHRQPYTELKITGITL
jgi:large subunit ribosomal protein L21